jgi:hypothetical protein
VNSLSSSGDSQTLRSLDGSLSQELEAWAAAGLIAKLWWRDDDAVTDTAQLRRLFEVAGGLRAVVAVAVIPKHADQSLVNILSANPCCVWQHGWGHNFHKSGEFGDGRAVDTMVDDALAGARTLDSLFGPAGWQKVFVPPNHMLSLAFKTLIPRLGYVGLSAGSPLTPPIRGVMEFNAEIDVMNWPEGKILEGSAIEEMIVNQLRARRVGLLPPDQPIGILTHHLVFDEVAWTFISDLFRSLRSHRAVEMIPADRLFCRPSLGLQINPTVSPASNDTKNASGVTVVITSCGRRDLLERTLSSFFHYNTYPVQKIIVMEDGRIGHELAGRFEGRKIDWRSTTKRIGQIKAIDTAYREVETDFIFHCEDDWEFFESGFIEKSLAVLSNAEILQVWIRALSDTNNHPVMEEELFADGIPYRLLQPDFDSGEWGTWHGFSFNPGLRRLCDYHLLGSFGALDDPFDKMKAFEIERAASEFYRRHGFLAAILTDNHGGGYCKHIGWGRRLGEPPTE